MDKGEYKDKWVAPHCTGGLGNRLFQFAAAWGCAERWSSRVIFLLPKCQFTDHGPFENIFKLFPHIPRLESATDWETIKEPRGATYRFLDLGEHAPAARCLIDGYRQSPLYFPKQAFHPDFEGAVGAELWLQLQKAWKLETLEQRRQTWFLHVRLGDYKVLPHHQVQLSQYYLKCLERVQPGHRILFFSDEPELCATAFQQLCQQKGIPFELCNEKDELKSLGLMSLCWGGGICANSTFSWWGVYFAHESGAEQGVQVPGFYPSQWGSGLPPPTDLIPSWGSKIDV